MFGEGCPQNTQGPLSRDLKSKEEGIEGERRVMTRLFCTFTTCKMNISAVGLERGRLHGVTALAPGQLSHTTGPRPHESYLSCFRTRLCIDL